MKNSELSNALKPMMLNRGVSIGYNVKLCAGFAHDKVQLKNKYY